MLLTLLCCTGSQAVCETARSRARADWRDHHKLSVLEELRQACLGDVGEQFRTDAHAWGGGTGAAQ